MSLVDPRRKQVKARTFDAGNGAVHCDDCALALVHCIERQVEQGEGADDEGRDAETDELGSLRLNTDLTRVVAFVKSDTVTGHWFHLPSLVAGQACCCR